MTWYETIYLWSFLIVPILIIIIGALCTDDGDLISGTIGLYFILATVVGALMTLIGYDTEWVITKKIEITPKVAHISDDGLNIITENSKHYRFTDYKDIKTWENGGKFYAVSYFNKENFGIDSSKLEVIIEK